MVLTITIAIYLLTAQAANFTLEVPATVLFCRFICGTILHLSLLNKVTKGLHNMKFALNHHYMFHDYFKAAVMGFL